MPELPEVETVVRDLRPLLVGCRVTAFAVADTAERLRLGWDRSWEPLIRDRRFSAVRRRGKWIILDFDQGGCLLVHLGMTGQLTLTSAESPRDSHCHLGLHLDDGSSSLRYRDTRRFGGVRYCETTETAESFLGERLGPEPWNLEPAAWYRSLTASRRPLKAILLDQTVVAGVGNIYADEALHLARLAPTRMGCDTTRRQATRLRTAVVAVLERAIAARGSTIRDYIGGSGLAGGFQHALSVYGREGEPCPRCGTLVTCIRLAGRSTHYCPECQSSASDA